MEINQITMLTAPILVLQKSDLMLLGKRGILKRSSGVYEFTEKQQKLAGKKNLVL